MLCSIVSSSTQSVVVAVLASWRQNLFGTTVWKLECRITDGPVCPLSCLGACSMQSYQMKPAKSAFLVHFTFEQGPFLKQHKTLAATGWSREHCAE